MNATETKIWLSALAITSILYAGLFIQWQNTLGISSHENSTHPVVNRLSLKLTAPPKPLTTQPKPQQPKPVITDPFIKDSQPLPVISEKPSTPELKPINEKQEIVNEVLEHSDKSDSIEQVKNTATSEHINASQKQAYIDTVLQHIEKHKYYPGAARRRGINGKVTIQLEIGPDGRIVSLNTQSQYRVLKRAARGAIEAAQPLPTQSTNLTKTVIIEFTIEYALRD